jgi:hypothetical protein
MPTNPLFVAALSEPSLDGARRWAPRLPAWAEDLLDVLELLLDVESYSPLDLLEKSLFPFGKAGSGPAPNARGRQSSPAYFHPRGHHFCSRAALPSRPRLFSQRYER